MNRIDIILALVVLVFVQLVKGQNQACTDAIDNVSDACGTSLLNGDMSVCSGTCATQLNAVVSACASSTDSDIQASISAYNALCGSAGTACATATAAILADDTCDPDTVSASVLCTGTCRTLADNFINACPADNPGVIAIRGEVNRLCGSGNMLKTSGVITLLIVAISALLF